MKEHPIIFNTEMVRAILEDRKTQTREPIRPQPPDYAEEIFYWVNPPNIPKKECAEIGIYYRYSGGLVFHKKCPWQIGDRLWVREAWMSVCDMDTNKEIYGVGYKEAWINKDYDNYFKVDEKAERYFTGKENAWRPSIHMPRWASRITLEITKIWGERIQDISFEDALAEGCKDYLYGGYDFDINSSCVRANFHRLWDSIAINFNRWDFNPWVWVREFKRIK